MEALTELVEIRQLKVSFIGIQKAHLHSSGKQDGNNRFTASNLYRTDFT